LPDCVRPETERTRLHGNAGEVVVVNAVWGVPWSGRRLV